MADLRAVARAKAKKYGLDPGVFERQIQQESGFNPGARSPAGALGVAQIMPATARGWGVNPLNSSQALDAAARNMARYVQQFGSYEKALRAYNAGPGNVERSRSFAETNNYVRTILGGGGGSAPRLLTTKRTVPGALIAGAAGCR
jgi:soluble lytic murein transglycosylase-like protein